MNTVSRRRWRCILFLNICLVGLPAFVWGDLTYVVKKQDTLSSIGRRYDVSVAQLARHNGIKERDKIFVGQRLRIPSSTVDAVVGGGALPDGLSRIRVSSRWKHIVIHHSGVSEGDVKGMDRYHREIRHMENGLAYHFVIGNGRRMRDGEIAMCDRWRRQLDGGHLASLSQNRTSIGICLVGNFDKKRPTRRQLESLKVLVLYLMRRCHLGVDSVKTHQQINVIHTRCPGKYFPTKTFIRDLRR